MLQLSSSSSSWPRRKPCLIMVPKTARKVAVAVKGGDGKDSAVLRCRYGETRTRRRYAEQDIKWLGRCEEGAAWQIPPSPPKVRRRGRRRSGDDVRFVMEVTDGGGGGGGEDQVLELRYSTADAKPFQQQKLRQEHQPQQRQQRFVEGAPKRPTCGERPSSPTSVSSRSGGFVLGGENGECALAVNLGHAFKIRLKFFTSAAEGEGKKRPRYLLGCSWFSLPFW